MNNFLFVSVKSLRKPFLLFCFFAATAIADAQSITISATDKRLSYSGRVGYVNSEAAAIYWPGTSVTVRFKGTGATAVLKDSRLSSNHFLVIVDGKDEGAMKLKLDTLKKTFTLARNLPFAEHTIQLFKLTDLTTASLFYGFELEGKAKLLKPLHKPKRKIEFYGNSITAGHGVDVPVDSADNGKPQFFDNYRTYGAVTARHFNAQYHCTAKSGIGLTVSWFPEIMPEIYIRLNPYDSTSKWDFSAYQPDIVVVNLFQNDSWIVNQPDHAQFKARFGKAKPSEEFIIQSYATFIRTLRGKYPKATIICCLGSMDITRQGSRWPGYVEAAVASLHDQNVMTHFFAYKNTPGHPKLKEQRAMADDLIAFIEARVWKNH